MRHNYAAVRTPRNVLCRSQLNLAGKLVLLDVYSQLRVMYRTHCRPGRYVQRRRSGDSVRINPLRVRSDIQEKAIRCVTVGHGRICDYSAWTDEISRPIARI